LLKYVLLLTGVHVTITWEAYMVGMLVL
jgi:hypothetical protein